MLDEIEYEETFQDNLIFGDEFTFRISGQNEFQNCGNWGIVIPCESWQHVLNSSKGNVLVPSEN